MISPLYFLFPDVFESGFILVRIIFEFIKKGPETIYEFLQVDTSLLPFMQSLNLNPETCKAQNAFIRNEIFKSSKISFCCIEDSTQTVNPLSCFDGSNEATSYGPFHEQLSKVEGLSKQIPQASSKNSCEGFKNSLKNEGPMEKICSNIKINLNDNNIMKKDVLKGESPNGEDTKTLKCFFRSKKVGEIISTSRSGHLIERKPENCFVVPEKTEKNSAEGCDPNDNIIVECEKPHSEMHDINDNPSEKLVYQKEEEVSLSDNARSANSDSEALCGIGLLERLIRSHPVWFLPGIQRAGAVHLLQGKEEGNFIVRQSSQPETMAVSVRLPTGKGPYIEHYLIQAVDGQLSLESSENMFESIPSLIAHYCQCCDELPVQLTLPRTIREARNRQQLSSLALLGQEFWRYPMANPRPPESHNSSPNGNKSDSFSSFEGVKKLVKQNNEIVLDLVPLHRDSQSSNLSTFKNSLGDGINSSAVEESKPKRPHTLDLICTNAEKSGLTHGPKTPPQPPPRWTKPTSLITKQFSSVTATMTVASPTSKTNQTVIVEEERKEFGDCSSFASACPITGSNTPVTQYDFNISSPQSDQTNLRSFAFERDMISLKYCQEIKRPQLISPVSDNTSLVSKGFEKIRISPSPASTPTDKVEHIFKKYKKDTKVKESAHYQECDILESPTLHYYKSNVADKQSDYEDIWATDSFTTFKPSTPQNAEPETRKNSEKPELKKPPDLLEKLDKQYKITEKKHEKVFNSSDNCDTEELDASGAQNSPFYAEPADALVVRRKTRLSFNKSRHSDPFSFNNWSTNANPYFSGGNVLDRIDSQNEVNEDMSWKGKPSLSFDNINYLKKKEGEEGKPKVTVRCKNVAKAKPVRPPKVDNAPLEKSHQNWTVDSSWEFIGNDEIEKEGERRFPSIEQQMDSVEGFHKYTVQEIITQRFPHFKISKGFNNSANKSSSDAENPSFSYQMSFMKSDNKSGSRISAYDNLTSDRPNFFKSGSESDRNSEANCDNFSSLCPGHDDFKLNESFSPKNQISSDSLRLRRQIDYGSVTEDNEDAQTIFSEPWDSSRWENLLPTNTSSIEESCLEDHIHFDGVSGEEKGNEGLRTSEKTPRKLDLSMPLTGLKSKEVSGTGASIRSYALHLASDKSTTFAQNIDNFIDCTLESKETNPQVVMRNMRQFMSGMKNYLVKHGEREFEKQVERERMKLKSTEFLNLDAILEGVMHKLVVRPLREHLYKLFVDEYMKNGAIQLLYDNLIYARTKSLHDLGLRSKITPPCQEALEAICHYVLKLQEVDSPLEKLDHLLACVSTIIQSVKLSNQEKANIALGADDILPLFVWVLVQSGFIAAEIESEYMWGLLHPSLLSGEGCYYLTTLSSAVHVLKNLKFCDLEQPNRTAPEWHCGELKSVLKIIVPDELHGSILTKTLPVKPNMTTKDVCKIIAHKIRITNPQDYGLFRLVDGEETLLNDNECPQEIKSQLLKSGKHCTLAYKRIDAKIGWPRTA